MAINRKSKSQKKKIKQIDLRKFKKLQNDLNELDVQYLTDHPKKISRKVYLKKRNNLKVKFNKLKNMLK